MIATPSSSGSLPYAMCIPLAVLGGAACEALGPRRLQLLLLPLLAAAYLAVQLAQPLLHTGWAPAVLLASRAVQVGWQIAFRLT